VIEREIMVRVCIEVDDVQSSPSPMIRFVPKMGPVREQSGPVTKSPQFARPFKVRNLLMALTLTATQFSKLSIAPKDRKGNPAKLDGVPEWATDNSEILTITPSADGLSCDVTAVGMIGTANVQVTGDADVGSGVTPIIGTLEVEVIAGNAITVDIDPGTPTEQP
jgi:hypothetical protein